MNLLQSGFPLNTCSRGISDGQHVFSKPLFPSTSIIAVSIRSFTEKSVCASSFSKVALEASFFFVFVFVVVKGSLMTDVLTKITVTERRQTKANRANEKRKKKKIKEKKQPKKPPSFSFLS
jgi:hypothetical protein|tara:strand:- start:172 stop:534 length:363 start_codon:yes stop_codon:yes gene_type:complete